MDERVAWPNRRSENVLPRGQPVLRRDCLLDAVEVGLKFRYLEEGEIFTQNLVNKYFI